MKNYTLLIIALMVCGFCIVGVSAVPVIVGFKDTPAVRFDDRAGVNFQMATAGTTGTDYMPMSSLGTIKYVYPDIHAVAMDISEEEIAKLRTNENVKYVEPDYVVTALAAPTMPFNIKQIGADKVQAAGNDGSGVRVAVIDTGIDYTHPDLKDVYAGGYNFVNENNNPMDDNGHGTHCSGIIAATGSQKGIYGTAPGVSLYGVKVLDYWGYGYTSDVVEGIYWAKNNSMQVASMSLGSGYDSQAMHDAVINATENGVLIVAAAGNSGSISGVGETMGYPAKYDNVLAVAAVNKHNHRAFWSSTGFNLGVSAPGVKIRSTVPGAGYATYSGTSMATPHVAGVAALVYSAHPDWTNLQVKQKIVDTATPLGNHWLYGAGLVNAVAAADVSGVGINDISAVSESVADDDGFEDDGVPFSLGPNLAEASA
ncbi:MAG: S8 family serine peptidase [Methanoregula sp.]|nr:S8 family serine peptidase [Methanoregula sp.]